MAAAGPISPSARAALERTDQSLSCNTALTRASSTSGLAAAGPILPNARAALERTDQSSSCNTALATAAIKASLHNLKYKTPLTAIAVSLSNSFTNCRSRRRTFISFCALVSPDTEFQLTLALMLPTRGPTDARSVSSTRVSRNTSSTFSVTSVANFAILPVARFSGSISAKQRMTRLSRPCERSRCFSA